MAWTNSKIFSAFITDALNNTAALDMNSDTLNAALFDNTVVPDQTVASASTAYGAGVWAAGGVGDTPSWPAAGRPLVPTSTFASNVYTLDSADTVSADATTTLAAVFGALIYDDTLVTPVADQGISFNYFGGTNSVTNGTFTVIWAAAGVLQLTL